MTSFITAIGTANPANKFAQRDIVRFMSRTCQRANGSEVKMEALYRATGIRYRYTVLEDYGKIVGTFSFFPNNDLLEPFPGTRQRMVVYQKEAIKLATDAIHRCFQINKTISKKDITHLITVSCTGFYAPGLDIDIVNNLGLDSSISRTAINYMGCYAAISALRMGDAIIRAETGAKVLIVCVELCTLHFQKEDNEDNLLANALFGDGAAAVLLESSRTGSVSFALNGFLSEILTEGKNDMAWTVGDSGFEMKLSRYVPVVIRNGLGKLTSRVLNNFPELKAISDIAFFAIHPGGKKILESVEMELGIPKEKNRYAYAVLNKYGNMSSPTILFVLWEIMADLTSGNHDEDVFCMAFGPGITLESMMLKIVAP